MLTLLSHAVWVTRPLMFSWSLIYSLFRELSDHWSQAKEQRWGHLLHHCLSSQSVPCILIRIHWLQWVQGGSTAARPSIRVKSSLTGGGLSCRLAWRTVCLDQSTSAGPLKLHRGLKREACWGPKREDKPPKFGCFGLLLSHTESFYYDVNADILHLTAPVHVCTAVIQA